MSGTPARDQRLREAGHALRALRRWLIRLTRRPRVGRARFGDLGRSSPISRDWGFDRGTPLDRFYIERFLAASASDIRGRVLEVADNAYTKRFGGQAVTRSEILHPVEGNPRATVVADLGRAHPELSEQFDCIICTQTLQFVYPLEAAATALHAWLRPGGVLLITVPGISQISREDMEATGDYWRFTTASLRRLFESRFGAGALEVTSHGNVLAATMFLHGLAAEELDQAALLESDPQYQMLLSLRAVKGA